MSLLFFSRVIPLCPKLVPLVVLLVLDVLGTVYANHMLRGVDGVAAWAGVCWSVVLVAVVHVCIITYGGDRITGSLTHELCARGSAVSCL